MTECTRCGRQTNREAISDTGPEEHSENGMVWLCDSCFEKFGEFLANPYGDVTNTLVQTILEADPNYRLTSMYGDGSEFIMVEIPREEGDFTRGAAGEFVALVSNLGENDG